MAHTRRHNLETVIKLVAEMIPLERNHWLPPVAWNVPQSHTVESYLAKLCALARAGDLAGLHECDLYLKHNNIDNMRWSQLTDWAMMVLAWEGNQTAVELITTHFRGNLLKAKNGYAWGGHFALCDAVPQRDIYVIEGYALGRHIQKVNHALNEADPALFYTEAVKGYSRGGYLNNVADTMLLIVFSHSKKLRKAMAEAYTKKYAAIQPDLLLAKANKIKRVMHNDKKTYHEAVAMVNAIERRNQPGLFNESHLKMSNSVQSAPRATI